MKFEIKEEVAVISQRNKWTLELNRVSWNGADPKLDLRAWSADHEKMSKGITLTDDEAAALCTALQEII